MNDYRDQLALALAPRSEPAACLHGLFVRRPSFAEARDLQAYRAKRGDGLAFASKALAAAVVGEDGKPALTEGEAAALPALVRDAIGRQLAAITADRLASIPGPRVVIDGPPPLAGLVEFSTPWATVFMRGLTESDRRAFNRELGRNPDQWRATAWGVARSVAGPGGDRLFSESQVFEFDYGAVEAIGARVLQLINCR